MTVIIETPTAFANHVGGTHGVDTGGLFGLSLIVP